MNLPSLPHLSSVPDSVKDQLILRLFERNFNTLLQEFNEVQKLNMTADSVLKAVPRWIEIYRLLKDKSTQNYVFAIAGLDAGRNKTSGEDFSPTSDREQGVLSSQVSEASDDGQTFSHNSGVWETMGEDLSLSVSSSEESIEQSEHELSVCSSDTSASEGYNLGKDEGCSKEIAQESLGGTERSGSLNQVFEWKRDQSEGSGQTRKVKGAYLGRGGLRRVCGYEKTGMGGRFKSNLNN